MVDTRFFPPIGLAGAAGVGKDTLYTVMENVTKEYNIKRYSMAGDSIKKDLYDFLKYKINISSFTTNPTEKNIIRPMLVEYGRLMRNQTKGRYFINQLQSDPDFGKDLIPVITDVRYAEYEQDELYWLKEEKKGLLVFLEREGINPANEFEEKNNFILKNNCNLYFNIKNTKEYYSELIPIAKKILKNYTKMINYHFPTGHLSAFKYVLTDR